MNDKEFEELYNYRLCKITKIDKSEIPQYQDKPNKHIHTNLNDVYLCELDEYTNTRILFAIFKSVFFIKTVVLISLICGAIAVVLNFIR